MLEYPYFKLKVNNKENLHFISLLKPVLLYLLSR